MDPATLQNPGMPTTDPNQAPNPFLQSQSQPAAQPGFTPPQPNPVLEVPTMPTPQAAMPATPVSTPNVGTVPAMDQPNPASGGLNLGARPEVVSAANGKVNNGPWIVLGVLAMVVVVGVLGSFAYFSMVAVTPVEVAEETTPVVQATPTPVPSPKVPTLEEKIAIEEASLTELQTSLSAADKSLSDKQGDLSE
jgi:hypothetical protein